MPKMEKADAVEAMLSEMRCALPTDAQRAASLQRQLDALYAAFVLMERERDEAIRECERLKLVPQPSETAVASCADCERARPFADMCSRHFAEAIGTPPRATGEEARDEEGHESRPDRHHEGSVGVSRQTDAATVDGERRARQSDAGEGRGTGAVAEVNAQATPVAISLDPHRLPLQGSWAADDWRRAFVEGAQWWEWTKAGATMWPSDRNMAEGVAEERFARLRGEATVRPEGLAADVPRILELCAEFDVHDADQLKHHLESYARWRHEKLHAAVRVEE